MNKIYKVRLRLLSISIFRNGDFNNNKNKNKNSCFNYFSFVDLDIKNSNEVFSKYSTQLSTNIHWGSRFYYIHKNYPWYGPGPPVRYFMSQSNSNKTV